MTESEWLACTNPRCMIKFMSDKVSVRKLRLFALGCFVTCCGGVGKKRRRMHAVTEAFADGEATVQQIREHWAGGYWPEHPVEWALALAQTRSAVQKKHRSEMARCIFGNPFRPVALKGGGVSETVRGLAQAAYEDLAPSSREMDRTRLAILADALEEAGCSEQAILDHLRGPGLHVRGCHAVDLVLGREGP